jgi:hypothetical protein
LGRPLDTTTAPDRLVLRYLAGFGPASVADMQKWSGLTRLREVFDRLGPQLRQYRDEKGTQLYDLPDARRPDPDTPAPVRFLPEFDNLLLAYADGSRVMAAAHRPVLFTVNGIIRASVLVDGVTRAVWKVTRAKRAATLEVAPLDRLTARVRSEIESEGARLLAFVAAEADSHDIRFAPTG